MGRFETRWLTVQKNLSALVDLSGQWIDQAVRDSSWQRPQRGRLEGRARTSRGALSGQCLAPLFPRRCRLCQPEVYEFLEAESFKSAIRLPANSVLQERIGYLLKCPAGRPPIEVRRYHASFSYRAQSWKMARRAVAKVEWHPGELYPRAGFVVSRPAERAVGSTISAARPSSGSGNARMPSTGRGGRAVRSLPMPCVSSSTR